MMKHCAEHEEIELALNTRKRVNATLFAILALCLPALIAGATYVVREIRTTGIEQQKFATEVRTNYVDVSSFQAGQSAQDNVFRVQLTDLTESVRTLRQQAEENTKVLYRIAGTLEHMEGGKK